MSVYFKLRRSAARSSVKPPYGNEDSGMSVMSETCVREEKIIKNSYLSFLFKKDLKVKDRKGNDIGKEKTSPFCFD